MSLRNPTEDEITLESKEDNDKVVGYNKNLNAAKE